jgi:SpoVK/Ycf46/Vps4 family AAA+-type ATPase
MTDNELLRALQGAVEASPDNLALRKHLADLLVAQGLYADAIQHYRRALDLAPGDSDLKLALVEAYTRLGKNDVALVVLEDLMRTANPPPKALLSATRLYLDDGQLKEAARIYRLALAKDPGLADPDLDARLSDVPLPVKPALKTPPPPPTRPEPDKADKADKADKEMVFVVGKDEPDAASIYEVERPKINFRSVGGMDKLKEEIRMKIIYPMAHPELFRAYGKPIGGGILMYGPPGCGKTHLARATAGEVQAAFLSIGLHDVLDMYIGQSERNLHQIFELARQKAPCVLFFDEVDALGGNRADMRHNAMRQVINQLLSEMDGVDASNEGVLILAATNTPWYVDQALRRPGRFDRVLFVPPPDAPAREAILRLLLEDKPSAGVDYARLANEAKNFSGADLKGAVDQAIEQKLGEAMRRGTLSALTTNDVLLSIRQQRATTLEWFETARNYAVYSNEGGLYDDVLTYLKLPKGTKL